MTSERKPHPHADVIKQWADGHKIQCRSVESGEWVDLADHAIVWSKTVEYRVKPTPKPEPKTWYQVVCKNDFGPFIPDGLFSSKASAESLAYTVLKLIPIYTEESTDE